MGLQSVNIDPRTQESLILSLSNIIQELYNVLDNMHGLGDEDERYVKLGELKALITDEISGDTDGTLVAEMVAAISREFFISEIYQDLITRIDSEAVIANIKNNIEEINNLYGDTVSAAQSAIAAGLSAESAATYAESAATSETNAGLSADAANTSAGIATTKAGEAESSATAASVAKTAAEAANTSAGTYASAASTHADTASAKATEAGGYATAASGYATTATTKASEASGYATTAVTASGNAATSETNAGNYATNANNSAVAASNSAITAQTYAAQAEQDYTALSETVSTHTTTLGNHTSSIETLEGSYDGIKVKYGVKLDVNGRVTGFEILGTGVETTAAFLVDKFIIANPGYSDVVPFAIYNNKVVMDGAYIKDLTVDTLQIKNNATTNALSASRYTTQGIAYVDRTWFSGDSTASVTLTCTGAPVIITGNVKFGCSLVSDGVTPGMAYVDIMIDSTVLISKYLSGVGGAMNLTLSGEILTRTTMNTPSAGSHTFKLRLRGFGMAGSGYNGNTTMLWFEEADIIVLEVKK